MESRKDYLVLIVDDDEGLREAMSTDFSRKGYQVLTASNGKEALKLVETHKIDLILTDVRMPGGNGIELLDSIKKTFRDTPVVVFITAFADLTGEEAYHKGADAIFTKPFERKALFATVERALIKREERWACGSKSFSADSKIQLEFDDLASALKRRDLNFGRGGLFIAIQEHFPKNESKVSFRLTFNHHDPKLIEGNGLVRWVRMEASNHLRKGCGIEFWSINDQALQQVIELIRNLEAIPFIPMD